MANTIQKKIKFSKGQIVPELVERTDLGLYDSSAQNMKNVVSTVYGGVRSRRGTKYVSGVYTSQLQTGTVTADLGGNLSNVQELGGSDSGTIGTNRDILSIDYGFVVEEGLIAISNIKLNSLLGLHSFTTTGTHTFNIYEDKELYIEMTGGGGGGSNSFGGRGAGIKAYMNLKSGTGTFVIGSGGRGAEKYVRNHDGVSGTASTFVANGAEITCGGGIRRRGRRNGGGGGNTGTLTYSFEYENNIKSKTTNGQEIGVSFLTNNYSGAGAGGQPQGHDEGAGYAGKNGSASVSVGNIKTVFETSEDGSSWSTILTKNITTDGSNIDVVCKNFRYVRLRIVDSSSWNYNGTLHIGSIVLYSTTPSVEKTRIIPFFYNEQKQFLFVITKEAVLVYENEILKQKINVDIDENIIDEIKHTSKDDTLILVHKDMKPKIIKNIVGSGWTFGDLDLKNIPYAVFGEETEEKKTTGITPSELEGAVKITADSAIFSSSWEGQYLDGNGGRVKITEYVSETVVNGYTVIPFYTKDKISNWTYISGYEPVWSETRGYPRTCLFAQQRLWFGGSKDKPATVWASRLGDYFNFKNSGNYDNDSIDADLLTNDPIVNMVDNRGLHIFTTGQEMTVSENSFTPDTFSVTVNTRNGSYSRVNPIVFGGVVGFIEKNGKSLLSYVYDYNQASYMTDNISLFSNLIKKPVSMSAEVNSEKDKGDFLFLALEDGSMLVMCVSLSEDIKSISRVETDGKITDVCSVGSNTYILVDRNGFYYIEKIDDVLTDFTKTFYVSGKEVGGLEDYVGKVIYVYNDIYNEKISVKSNIIELKKSVEGNINIGLAFDYELESNPIAINGKTVDIKKRISSATLHCKDTSQITFNNQLKKDKDVYNFYACTKYDNDVRFKINGEFYPMEILSVMLNINYEG